MFDVMTIDYSCTDDLVEKLTLETPNFDGVFNDDVNGAASEAAAHLVLYWQVCIITQETMQVTDDVNKVINILQKFKTAFLGPKEVL